MLAAAIVTTFYPGPHTYTNDEDIPEEFRFIIQDSMDSKSDSYDTSSITTNESTNKIEVSYDSSEDSEDSESHTSFETDSNQVYILQNKRKNYK